MSTKLSYEIRNMSTTEKVVGVAVLAAGVYGVWDLLTYEPKKKYPPPVLPPPPGETDDWGVSTSYGEVADGVVEAPVQPSGEPGLGNWRIYRKPDARYVWVYRGTLPMVSASHEPFMTQEEAAADLEEFFRLHNFPEVGG